MAIATERDGTPVSESNLDKGAKRLRFPREFEQVFLVKYYRSSIGHIRLALGLGLVVYAIFGLVDRGIGVPEQNLAALIRYGIVCPFILIALILSFRPIFRRVYAGVFSVGILLVGLGVVFTNALHPAPEAWYQQTSLMLVLLFGYTFTRVRFWYATFIGWLTTAVALYGAWNFTKTPLDLFIYTALVLGTANVFGMFSAYLIEYYQRRHFLEERRRDMERLRFKRLSDDLRTSTNMDSLTGIANRYSLEQSLITAHRKSQQLSQSLTVAVLSVDYFTEFNQVVGHQKGDNCLREVARLLKQMPRRPGDLISRYAGAEFVVLLPDTDLSTSKELLRPILKGIDGLAISNPSPKADAFVSVTAAAAMFTPDSTDDPLTLLDDTRILLMRARKEHLGELVVRDMTVLDEA